MLMARYMNIHISLSVFISSLSFLLVSNMSRVPILFFHRFFVFPKKLKVLYYVKQFGFFFLQICKVWKLHIIWYIQRVVSWLVFDSPVWQNLSWYMVVCQPKGRLTLVIWILDILRQIMLSAEMHFTRTVGFTLQNHGGMEDILRKTQNPQVMEFIEWIRRNRKMCTQPSDRISKRILTPQPKGKKNSRRPLQGQKNYLL